MFCVLESRLKTKAGRLHDIEAARQLFEIASQALQSEGLKMPNKETENTKGAIEGEESSTEGGRPLWKGAISFGLVNVPVQLYTLEKSASEVKFRLIDRRDNGGIRYRRINEKTEAEVPWSEIAKAFEYSDDRYVILEEEDFEKVRIESSHTIDIQEFVPKEQISDTYFEKPYVVVPAKKSEKGYVLLRDALRDSGMAGIAKIAIRTREHLAALIPHGDALVVLIMRFAQELKNPQSFAVPKKDPEAYNINEKEVALAHQLVASMAGEWQPEQYRDKYKDALLAYIEQKVEGGALTGIDEAEEDEAAKAANVIDLASLLKQSVEKSGAAKAKSKEA